MIFVVIIHNLMKMSWLRRSSDPIRLQKKSIVYEFDDFDDSVSNYSDDSVNILITILFMCT